MNKQNRVDKFGEVMTPEILVNQMLQSLPEEVWQNPNNTFIDNSCGTGNFLVAAKEKLLQYHPESHILNHMLYGVEIQEDNAHTATQRLGGGNIACHDALTFHYWGRKFNVIFGNPPYNKEKKGKKGNNCNPLWTLFVDLSLKTLEENGYLLYVHPQLWRKPEHPCWERMKQYQIKELHIFSQKQSSKIFNVATQVDWYLLQKTSPYEKTLVYDIKGKNHAVYVADKPFIPHHSFEEVYKTFSGKTDVLYNCKYHHYTQKCVQPTPDETHTLPCVYTVSKKGIVYYYSCENKGHFGVPKVIIPMGRFQPINDFEGKYGMCEVAFGLPVKTKEEADKLLQFLESEYFLDIISACRWKTVQTDWRLFKYLAFPA